MEEKNTMFWNMNAHVSNDSCSKKQNNRTVTIKKNKNSSGMRHMFVISFFTYFVAQMCTYNAFNFFGHNFKMQNRFAANRLLIEVHIPEEVNVLGHNILYNYEAVSINKDPFHLKFTALSMNSRKIHTWLRIRAWITFAQATHLVRIHSTIKLLNFKSETEKKQLEKSVENGQLDTVLI